MRFPIRPTPALLLLLALVLATLPACGNKGPLVLPPPKAAAG